MKHRSFAHAFLKGKRTAGMNKTETAYALRLKLKESAGEVSSVNYEGMSLRIGPDVRYIPDFTLVAKDGVIECHECKAGSLDKDGISPVALIDHRGRIKLRAASEIWPFRFIMAVLVRGNWHLEVIE